MEKHIETTRCKLKCLLESLELKQKLRYYKLTAEVKNNNVQKRNTIHRYCCCFVGVDRSLPELYVGQHTVILIYMYRRNIVGCRQVTRYVESIHFIGLNVTP